MQNIPPQLIEFYKTLNYIFEQMVATSSRLGSRVVELYSPVASRFKNYYQNNIASPFNKIITNANSGFINVGLSSARQEIQEFAKNFKNSVSKSIKDAFSEVGDKLQSLDNFKKGITKAVNDSFNKAAEKLEWIPKLKNSINEVLKKPFEINFNVEPLSNKITTIANNLKNKIGNAFEGLTDSIVPSKLNRSFDIFGTGMKLFSTFRTYNDLKNNINSIKALSSTVTSIMFAANAANKGLEYMSFSGVDMTPYNVARRLFNPLAYVNPFNKEADANIYTAAQEYSNQEYQQSRVRTILPKEEWKGNEKTISEMQRKLKYSVSTPEILSLQYEILSAGYTKAEDSAKVTESALKLTKAGFAEAAETARLLVTTMQAYNQTAEESASTAAKLQAIVQQGITTVPELASVFGQLASVAAQAGVSIEDVGAAIAVLTQKGQNTSVASTSIQSLIIKTLNMTPEAEKALKRYSAAAGKAIQLNAALIRQKGFAEVLKEIGEVVEFDPEKLREIFPDIQAYRAAVSLLADRGTKLTTIKQDIGASTAAFLEEQFNISLGSQKEQFVQFINESKSLLSELGKEAVPLLNQFVQGAKNMLDLFKQLPDPAKKFLGILMQIKLTTSAVADMFSIVFDALKGLTVTLTGGALTSLFFRHLSDPMFLVKKVQESVSLGIPSVAKTVLQESFGLDSTYSILMDKLMAKGFDRTESAKAISLALKDTQGLQSRLEASYVEKGMDKAQAAQKAAQVVGQDKAVYKELLKNDTLIAPYLDKVRQQIQFSKQTYKAFQKVVGEGYSERALDKAYNVLTTETRRERKINERLKKIQEEKAKLINQLETADISPKAATQIQERIQRLEKREQQLKRNVPDARAKRALSYILSTTKAAENLELFKTNVQALDAEIIKRTGIKQNQITDELRSRFLEKYEQTVNAQIEFIQGKRNSQLRKSKIKQIRQEIREVNREISSLQRELRAATRAGDVAMQQELTSRIDQRKEVVGKLREDLAFYRSNPSKELKRTAVPMKDLLNTTLFSPEGLISAATTFGATSYFLSNLPTLTNLSKASPDALANLAVSGLFAAGTMSQFIKDYGSNLKDIFDTFFNPINLVGKGGLSMLAKGVGYVGNRVSDFVGVGRYLDSAANVVPFLQNNTIRGYTGLGLTAAAAIGAGIFTSAAIDSYKRSSESRERVTAAETAANEMLTSWNSLQEKVAAAVEKNTEATTENTEATENLSQKIKEFLLPETEEEVISSTVKTIEENGRQSKVLTDKEFEEKINRLNEYKGEDFISAVIGRPTKRFFGDIDFSLSNTVGISPDDIQDLLATAAKDPRKYQTLKASLMEVASKWSDTQDFMANLVSYDKKLSEFRNMAPENLFSIVPKDKRDKLKQLISSGQQLTPDLIDAITLERRKQAGKIESFKKSLAEEAALIEEEMNKALKSKNKTKAATLSILLAEYRTKLKEYDDIEKRFKGAKEFGQEQIEGYNQFARNLKLKQESQGSFVSLARAFAVQEITGYEEGRRKIEQDVEQGVVQGNFMQILKDNLSQEFEAIQQSLEDGAISFEYAVEKLKEIKDYEISFNGTSVSPFSPREQLQIETKIIEIQKQRLDIESEYYTNLKKYVSVLRQIEFSKSIEALNMMSQLLDTVASRVSNASEAVRSSIDRLRNITDSFADFPFQNALATFQAYSRQTKIKAETAQLNKQLLQEDANYNDQVINLDIQKKQNETEKEKLMLELKAKQSRYDAEVKLVEEKGKKAKKETDPVKKEVAQKEYEEAKRNLAALDKEISQQKAKVELLKAQNQQIDLQKASLENQVRLRKLNIEMQKKSLEIESKFLGAELEIEKRVNELRRQIGEQQWNRETLFAWQNMVSKDKAPEVQSMIEFAQAEAEDTYLDKKYEMEKKIHDLLVEQTRLSLERQRIETNILQVKLKAEKISIKAEMAKIKNSKKDKDRYQMMGELVRSLDDQISALNVTKKRFSEMGEEIMRGADYQRSVMRQNYEDNKLKNQLRKDIAATGIFYQQEMRSAQMESQRMGFRVNFLDTLKNRVSNVLSGLGLPESVASYELERKIIEIKAQELELTKKTKILEIESAEARLEAEIKILEAKREHARVNDATKSELLSYDKSIEALRNQARIYKEQKALVEEEMESQLSGLRLQTKLPVEAEINKMKSILQFFNNTAQEFSNYVNNAKDFITSRYSSLASFVSQYYPSKSIFGMQRKQELIATLELRQEESAYRFGKLTLDLKLKELEIATKLKELEVSAAETKLKAELSILEAKKQQVALSGGSAEEIESYELAIKAMKEQVGLFSLQKKFILASAEIQRESMQLQKDQFEASSGLNYRIAQAKYNQAQNVRGFGRLTANQGFRQEIENIVATYGNIPAIKAAEDRIYGKALDAVSRLDSLLGKDYQSPRLGLAQSTDYRTNLSIPTMNSSLSSEIGRINVSFGSSLNVFQDAQGTLERILSELISFHRDVVSMPPQQSQSVDAIAQVTSALRSLNTRNR